MRRHRPQEGLAAATILIVIILAAVALVLGRGYFKSEASLGQRAVTEANLKRVSEALVQFASLSQRLPCPASGALDTGIEDASAPFSTCNSPDGVVPWAALALRRADALDGWGRKLSYRAFSGPTGLTQTSGASMVDCNTNAAATGAVDANGRCPGTRQTPPSAFLAGKGLSIQTDAATSGGYAFVLVSHGESGLGAFAAEGPGRVPPPPASALEYRNTQSGATFDNRARSAPDVKPGEDLHFDDMVLAVSITDIVNSAKLAGRDWGAPPAPPPVASQSFGAADLAAVLDFTPDPNVNANTGQNDIDFGSFRVRAFGSDGRNVSYGQGSSGTGIGSIGSGLTANTFSTINSGSGESLRFQFDSLARYLGITLVDFGTASGDFERVRFTFSVGGSTVQVTKTACRAGNVLANFTLNPGGDFDEVFVEAMSTVPGADASQFLIKAIATCPAGNPSCSAPGAVADDNCP